MTSGIDGIEYDKMVCLAQNVLLDYGVSAFPVDVYGLAKRIGMNIVPYSSLPIHRYERLTAIKGTEHGITITKNSSASYKYETYYNDVDLIPTSRRFTIAHEIKHVVSGDCIKDEIEEADEKLADYFAKCLLAPQAIIIDEKLQYYWEYVERFDISQQVAMIWSYTVEKRKRKFGSDFLFDHEKEFLRIRKSL